MNRSLVCLSSLSLVAAFSAGAQQLPPVRPLGPVTNVSKDLLQAVSSVRQLPGGRVLVNDINARRLLLFDSSFASFTVVADSTAATGNAYSSRAAGLIPYRSDSSLFVDPSSMSMIMIDPSGKIGRTMAVPRPQEAQALVGGGAGTPGFDSKGRLVYRGQPNMRFSAPAGGGGGGMPGLPQFPDSSPILRIDIASRKVDTVAMIKIPKLNMSMSQDANGRMSVTSIANPLPISDDWAILSDGNVAVVRGPDYRVDIVDADGKRTSAPKLPYDWQRMTDDDKVAFIDSSRVVMQKQRDEAVSRMGMGGPAGPAGPGGGAPTTMVITMGGDGGGRPAPAGGAAPATNQQLSLPPLVMVPPSDLPDYKPPFMSGAARGDMDGNLWIRTTKNINGSPVYDVVNAKGVLIDRVQLPPFRVIAGFGAGGWVYMGVKDGDGVRLERARIK